jgi:5-methylcytosine-specific restriction protein B
MPDSSLLDGAEVLGLALDELLDGLNRKVMERAGREKQIGHAYFLHEGKGIVHEEHFARMFRQEIVPLLQEYFYDDYDALADVLGSKLVERESRRVNTEALTDPNQLVQALRQMFGSIGADT